MKKHLAALLALGLTVSAFTGCGSTGQTAASPTPTQPATVSGTPEASSSPDTPVEKKTLTMAIWGNAEGYKIANEKFLETFPEYKDKVDFEVYLVPDGDVAKQIRLSLVSGQKVADILRLNYADLPEFASQGVFADVSKYMEPYRADIIDSIYNTVLTYEGVPYAFPHEVKPKVWYYRADIFAECGIDVSTVTTIDDFIAAGKKIQEKYPDRYIENYGMPEHAYDLMMQLSGNGGRFSDEKGNYVVSTDPNVRKAFETIKKLRESGVTADYSEWSADWQNSFADNSIVSQLTGAWFKQHLPEWVPEQKGLWAAAVWPEEMAYGSEAGAGIWVIPADNENLDLVGEVMAKFAFDPQVRKKIYDYNGNIAPLKSILTDDYYKQPHPFYGETLVPATMKAMEYFKVYPYNPSSSQEIVIAVQYLNEYIAGNMTLDQALKQAEADMKNQIGNPYQK